MTETVVPPRGAFGMAVIVFVMIAVLIGLGVWQLQRRVEKHALIAALTERLAAAPVPLPPPSQWKDMSAPRDEFRRVRIVATFEPKSDAMVYSSGSAVREDISGPGTWAFLPSRLADGGVVVVNAGFVQNTMQDRAQQDRAVDRLVTGMPVTLIGYLRFPEGAGVLTPQADTGRRLWFVRDQHAMAKSLGWGEVAPFYIDLESPSPPSGVPKPGPLAVHLKDDHLQYAITWLALAAAVLIAFSIWLTGQRCARIQPH